jgi:hypothetical protein
VIYKKGNETITRSASFLLNYDYLLSDSSESATNDKGKAVIDCFVLANHSHSLVPSGIEDVIQKCWSPLSEGTIKVNVDAAFVPQTGEAAIGAVARDHSDAFVAALNQSTSLCQSVEEADAKAMLAGLQLGIDLNLEVSVLESDCTTAISAANNQVPNRSKIWSIYKDIQRTRSLLHGCFVRHWEKP